MRSLGRSGRGQGFAALVSALVFTFVYDAVVADVLGHAGCALPSASATVQEFCADVAVMGPVQISWAWHVDKSVLSGTSSSVKFDWFVQLMKLVLAALLSAAIVTSWCGFCCGDARCGRCPRKLLGFQD